MFALDYQLDKIMEEGLEERFKRHRDMAVITRQWALDKFELFAQRGFESNTLTAITNTRGINVGQLNKKLGELGFMISNGYGDLKEKTFRIAHMANTTPADIMELLENINKLI